MQAAIKEVKGTIVGANGEEGKEVEWGGWGGASGWVRGGEWKQKR